MAAFTSQSLDLSKDNNSFTQTRLILLSNVMGQCLDHVKAGGKYYWSILKLGFHLLRKG